MYQVRQACQAFHNQAFFADRFEFEKALGWLAESAPAAASLQEAEALKDRLKICAVEAGTAFHQEYHRRRSSGRCLGSAVEQAQRAWALHHDDPRVTFKGWTRVFLAAFDATHPSSPAERAAAILRNRFSHPPDLNELAILAGASRKALTHDFRHDYGLSPGEYLTRVRLRWFVEEVRKPGSSATRLAERAGYKSYHNLTDSLRQRTHCTPTEIRRLTHGEIFELAHSALALGAMR